MKTVGLTGVHLSCAIVAFYLLLYFGAARIGMEDLGAGKGKVVLWVAISALLARSVILLMLQQTRLRARVEELAHPALALAVTGVADGLLLLPLFATFGHLYYPGAPDAPIESIFVVLIGPIALLAAMFPIVVNLGLRVRGLQRTRALTRK